MAHRHSYRIPLDSLPELVPYKDLTDEEERWLEPLGDNGCEEVTPEIGGYIRLLNKMQPYIQEFGETCPYDHGEFMVRWFLHEEALEAEVEMKKICPQLQIYEGG